MAAFDVGAFFSGAFDTAASSTSTLVAGTDGGYVGYVRVGSAVLGACGSLSSEPVAGQVIDYLVTGPDFDDGIAFLGNQSLTLISVIYVDGVAWTVGTGVYNSVDNITQYPLTNSDPDFVVSQSYTISTTPPAFTRKAPRGHFWI